MKNELQIMKFSENVLANTENQKETWTKPENWGEQKDILVQQK